MAKFTVAKYEKMLALQAEFEDFKASASARVDGGQSLNIDGLTVTATNVKGSRKYDSDKLKADGVSLEKYGKDTKPYTRISVTITAKK